MVVGGGVIGLTAAYYLRRDGADVTLLERAAVGSGASWGNSGWIAPTFCAPLPGPGTAATALRSLVRRTGSFSISVRHLPRLAPWLWRFWRASSAERHEAGLRAAATLARPTERLYDDLADDGVRFEMRPTGVLHAFLDGGQAEGVRRALLPFGDFGYAVPDAVIDGPRLRGMEPALGSAVEAGFVVAGERMVDPSSLLGGLKARLLEMGAVLREHRPVSGFAIGRGAITAVRSGDEAIAADDVVLAAGVWTRRLAAQLRLRLPLEAGTGYSFTVAPGTMPSHCVHCFEARVAASPFRAGLRLAGTMELSGMHSRLERRRTVAVARAAEPYFTGWRPDSPRDAWMGLRPMTPDGLPVLGRAGGWRNVFLATGHGMLGVTLAPATGRALAGIVLGAADLPELRPFSPDRFNRSRTNQGEHS